ncbi:MAG: hemerythrin family protein [Nitrosomonadales bacterium]|nr:hemerythrin family protein [Nitrosomonadales bacterium]
MAGHEPIVWNDSFVTGVDEIDQQHRILVNSLNAANAKLTANTNLELLDQISRDLLSYALYHFETEEELMQEYGYADQDVSAAQHHLEQHRSFSSKVVAVREGLKVGTLISREDLLSFLNDWLVNHILNTDKKLGAFIVAKRAGK